MTLYLLHIIYVLFYRDFLFIFVCERDYACRIQQRCFIYRSIFAIPTLRKRRVHVHCAAYHFRVTFKEFLHYKKVSYAIKTSFILYAFPTHLFTDPRIKYYTRALALHRPYKATINSIIDKVHTLM